MIIAEQKLKENIAEYLIYMYQVEDLIRANEFDAARIELAIINKFDVTYEVKREMLEWYKALIEGLIKEKKQKTGHLEFLILITDELNFMNADMLNKPLKKDVKEAYKKASPNIEALRMKSGHSNETDVQLAMNGLYGYLILRLQKKEISKETAEAFSAITEWIALLSAEYMMKK